MATFTFGFGDVHSKRIRRYRVLHISPEKFIRVTKRVVDGIDGTFYNWRSKYAGLEVNEAKRLKELESENNKLKKMLADKLLEVEAMKDVLSKKW